MRFGPVSIVRTKNDQISNLVLISKSENKSETGNEREKALSPSSLSGSHLNVCCRVLSVHSHLMCHSVHLYERNRRNVFRMATGSHFNYASKRNCTASAPQRATFSEWRIPRWPRTFAHPVFKLFIGTQTHTHRIKSFILISPKAPEVN